ncbi:MAG: hypothetical protein PHV77_06025 [Candidatus Omnitrophica bacterium]|nr:hypothetical protein [Candidatus Omnitrophota bacterium]
MIKKLKYIFLLTALCLLSLPVSADVSSVLWNTTKTQHFIIYYQEASHDFISNLSAASERYYNSIVDELGFRRMDFWSWDNRARIYMYPDSYSFQKESNRQAWAGAVVFVHNRTIKSYVGQPEFFDSILPHEMTHIIFREFIGMDKVLPLCVDEGVACSQEKSHLDGRLRYARDMAAQGRSQPFGSFFRIYNPESIEPSAFYAQSASIIVFLIKNYGKERFLNFSRKLRDGNDCVLALTSVYKFASLEDMESSWKKYVLNKR